jgi:hypothetical protein
MNDAQGAVNTPSQASDPDESRWVSYAELATARGISRLSAERLVRKKRWPKRAGNDNTIRVLVPAHELTATADGRPSNRPDARSDALPALRDALDILRGQLAREVARADAAEAATVAAQTDARAARERLAEMERAGIAAARARGRWARLRAAWRGE